MPKQAIETGLIVGKFGGTSMATPDRVLNVAGIIAGDSSRRVVTVSAPGAKQGDPAHDFRVTQALQEGHFNRVFERFENTAAAVLGVDDRYARVTAAIDESRRRAISTGTGPYAESRGEYFSAMILAEHMGATFVDPTTIIKLGNDGSIHPDTYQLIPQFLPEGGLYVVPGYFGANVNTDEVQLLPPGGTDLTGAILAKGVGASIYENWTDVKGVLSADPRIVENPRGIRQLTYDEMGELAHRGVNVLQVDAVEPVMEVGIPVNLRSSMEPDHPGTMVVDQRISTPGEHIIGIASREGFVSFQVGQPGMARQPGALARITGIFADEGISLEQGPGGRNHVSFITHSDQLPNGTDQTVMRRIREEVRPTRLSLVDNIGLVAVVGQRLASDATHVNAVMYPALSEAHIRTGAHIQSELPNSVVFSVVNRDVNRTVNVLYDALIG